MSKIARISATITARYAHSGGSTDAFWLDSRMPGPREVRAADITLDREDKGFFYSVFAAPSISKDPAYDLEAVKPALDRMHMDIKYSAKNIDNLIVDFAECSTGVVGKKTISLEGVRHPFFAGIIVKNAEVAAVATGRGCAYLYRNDTLYPLTHDNLGFAAVDYNGKNVPNIEIYCAGNVGNVRYSNIAQLQVDDCIIVCNREIMAAIGQKEMLRILNEAYDQSDAAGMVITEAASKLPGTTIQFMIGFVESIIDAGRHVKATAAAMAAPRFTPRAQAAPESAKALVDAAEEDDYMLDTEEDDEDDEDDFENSSMTKKIALLAVVLIVTAACVFAVWWTVFRNRGTNPGSSSLDTSGISISEALSGDESADTSAPEASGVSTVSSQAASGTATPTVNPNPTKAPTTAPSAILAKHTIAKGEWLSEIATKYYGKSTAKYLTAIVNANKAKYPSFTTDLYQEGWVLDIPKVD
ncbi:MAG: hypothetical protein ACYC5K_01815 [Saccharofermentanales bacterium]